MPILFKHSLPSYTWLQVTFSLILTHALTLFILSIQTWLFSPPFLPLFMITAKKAVNKALRLQVRILLYSYFILGLPFFFLLFRWLLLTFASLLFSLASLSLISSSFFLKEQLSHTFGDTFKLDSSKLKTKKYLSFC